MTPGQSLTIETIRVAAAFYVLSMAAWFGRRDSSARLWWTLACGFYMLHVAFAFQFFHHWSHAAAYQHTASQTAQMVGVNWGGGLYFNYVFTIIWVADVVSWWRGLRIYRSRPAWITTTIHWFFAFMFFNATVVFASGFIRWFGVAATLLLGALAIRSWLLNARSKQVGTR
jgi:hypothetical protein